MPSKSCREPLNRELRLTDHPGREERDLRSVVAEAEGIGVRRHGRGGQVDRLASGNPGDVRPVGRGVSELRIDDGPGYRARPPAGRPATGRPAVRREQVRPGPRHRGSAAVGAGVEEPWAARLRSSPGTTARTTWAHSMTPPPTWRPPSRRPATTRPSSPMRSGASRLLGNVSELARRIGMSREGLYKALSAEGNPSFATIVKVAGALGLKIHFESVA